MFVKALTLLLEPSSFSKLKILNLKSLFSRSSNIFIIPLIPMGLNKENASVEINFYGESFLYNIKKQKYFDVLPLQYIYVIIDVTWHMVLSLGCSEVRNFTQCGENENVYLPVASQLEATFKYCACDPPPTHPPPPLCLSD